MFNRYCSSEQRRTTSSSFCYFWSIRTLSRMFQQSLLIAILLWNFPLFETKIENKLTVMVSLANPFAIYDSRTQSLKGLDVILVDNFAKKFNLLPDYVIANQSLNEAFSSDESTERFLLSIKDLYHQ